MPKTLEMIPFDPRTLPDTPKAFLVGGSVRDLFLGLPSSDYDIAVLGNPEKYAKQIAQTLSGRLVLIGKPGRKIYRVVTPAFTVDISPIRGSSIQTDLMQRDFTVNAIACDLASGKWIDPFGAKSDLDKKKIRMISENAFKQDPIRLLRAFRLSASLNFTIGPKTLAAVGKYAHLIIDVAGERIRSEIMDLFRAKKVYPLLLQMAHSTLLFHLFPELKPLKRCRQNRFHALDVYQHTLSAFSHLEIIQNNPVDPTHQVLTQSPDTAETTDWALLKRSILLHDIGKPATRTSDPAGTVHFYGHAEKGAQMVEHVARRLRFSTRELKKTAFIIKNHVRPLHLFTAHLDSSNSLKAKTRFFIKAGDMTPELLLHAIADIKGKENSDNPRNEKFICFAQTLLKEFFTEFSKKKKDLPLLTGHDLIREMGLSPSPVFKTLLHEVEAARLSGIVKDHPTALALAKKLLIRLSP